MVLTLNRLNATPPLYHLGDGDLSKSYSPSWAIEKKVVMPAAKHNATPAMANDFGKPITPATCPHKNAPVAIEHAKVA